MPPGAAALAISQGDSAKSEAASIEWRKRVNAMFASGDKALVGSGGAAESKSADDEDDDELLAGLNDDLKDDGAEESKTAELAPVPQSPTTRRLRALGPTDEELGLDKLRKVSVSAAATESMPRATRSPDRTSGDFA